MIAPQIPPRAGLGLKPEHYREIAEAKPDLGFFEVHAENYMGAGGPPHGYLTRIREDYPVSLHGVGLSIGGEEELDHAHLARLKALCLRYQPGLFSEHLAWSSHGGEYLADLLPLPYTGQTLERVCAHIARTQDVLGRQMLLENPSSYLVFAESTWAETEFIRETARRTGCGLLLDVNNVFVSARNLGTLPGAYIAAYPLDLVQEIHLACHSAGTDDEGAPFLIDDHASPVNAEVWALYADVVARTGPLPTLIERDADVPPLRDLLAEAEAVEGVLSRAARSAAA